ncbi:MAG: hypothetical protein JWO76_259, partial [Nocardioides sp.]|nr:hypothetical protein [Nocardioides sp.]
MLAARQSGRGILEAAGDPAGTLWRVAVVLGAAPAYVGAEAAESLAERGWSADAPAAGVTGQLGHLLLHTAEAVDQPVGILLASVL